MYDGKTQLLIENPINRYLINSPMLPSMKTNADGSLTLYIQNKSPGADKEANWLPAPNDTIYLVMRLYWPKTDAAFDLAAGRRDMAAARHKAGLIKRHGMPGLPATKTIRTASAISSQRHLPPVVISPTVRRTLPLLPTLLINAKAVLSGRGGAR